RRCWIFWRRARSRALNAWMIAGRIDGFELAIRAVLGQHISVGAATKLAGRLVAIGGTRLRIDNPYGLTHTFPNPVHLLREIFKR
ncbi:MAG: hypothetical protein ACREXT_13525, partial [Gammaproteobacteria bacterium]